MRPCKLANMNPWSAAVNKWKKKLGKSDFELAQLIGVTPQAVTLHRNGSIARKKLREKYERASKGKVRAKLALLPKRPRRARAKRRSKK